MEDQAVVVDLLARNEEAVGRLYEAYAQRFPSYKNFWIGLANEEKDHARWVRELLSYFKEGRLDLKEGRFNIAAIKSFSKYLDGELAKAKDPHILLINALTVAKYVEEALIERKYFEVFEGDSEEVKRILKSLAGDTERHVRTVQQAWAKEK